MATFTKGKEWGIIFSECFYCLDCQKMLKRRKGAESALIFIEFYRHLHKNKARMEALQSIFGWIFSSKNILVDLFLFFEEYLGGFVGGFVLFEQIFVFFL